jgi:hypothetical protein
MLVERAALATQSNNLQLEQRFPPSSATRVWKDFWARNHETGSGFARKKCVRGVFEAVCWDVFFSSRMLLVSGFLASKLLVPRSLLL